MEVKLVLLQGQEKRIRRALKKQKGLRLTFKKSDGGGGDNDGGQQQHQQMAGTWLLKPSQWKVYNRAAPNSTFRLTFSAADMAKNINHSGGFLPLLAAILGPIIGGVAGAAVDRAISGAGVSFGGEGAAAKKKKGALLSAAASSSPRAYSLVLTKHLRSDNVADGGGGGGGGINSRLSSCRVAPAPDGNGLYLSPWTKNHPRDGAGLWLTPHPSQTHHHPHGGDIRVHRPTRSAHPILRDSYSKAQKRIMENFLL